MLPFSAVAGLLAGAGVAIAQVTNPSITPPNGIPGWAYVVGTIIASGALFRFLLYQSEKRLAVAQVHQTEAQTEETQAQRDDIISATATRTVELVRGELEETHKRYSAAQTEAAGARAEAERAKRYVATLEANLAKANERAAKERELLQSQLAEARDTVNELTRRVEELEQKLAAMAEAAA